MAFRCNDCDVDIDGPVTYLYDDGAEVAQFEFVRPPGPARIERPYCDECATKRRACRALIELDLSSTGYYPAANVAPPSPLTATVSSLGPGSMVSWSNGPIIMSPRRP